jgi:hypothetical protein
MCNTDTVWRRGSSAGGVDSSKDDVRMEPKSIGPMLNPTMISAQPHLMIKKHEIRGPCRLRVSSISVIDYIQRGVFNVIAYDCSRYSSTLYMDIVISDRHFSSSCR